MEIKMALKDTVKHMCSLLESIQKDMVKAEKGNKAASQRIRTTSIKFEKVAKLYRKESVAAEKSGGSKRKAAPKKAAKSPAKKSAAKKRAPAKKAAKRKKK
jgi:DNA-binding protein H-NS